MDQPSPIMSHSRRRSQTHSDCAEQIILNLGCGPRTSSRCINIDWSYYLLFRKFMWAVPILTPLIGADRAARLRAMRGKTIYRDLRRGIPYPDNSVDAVYHSHMMEHIDRCDIGGFQAEVFRVLKPGGLQRICLPDLELLIEDYVRSMRSNDGTLEHARRHDALIGELYEQSVRRRSEGIRGKGRLRAWIETWLIGDARQRGETHQWMWDRVNIKAVLLDAGFTGIDFVTWEKSAIPAWGETGLEHDSEGNEYKPGSLYVECRKPVLTACEIASDAANANSAMMVFEDR